MCYGLSLLGLWPRDIGEVWYLGTETKPSQKGGLAAHGQELSPIGLGEHRSWPLRGKPRV